MRNLFVLIFVLFFGGSQAVAQQFPITVIPQVTKPSPVYISNYADDSTINSPIQLRLLLNDITATNEQIRLKIYVEGNGISFQSRDLVIGSSPLFIDGGTPLLLNNVDLAPYYEFQNITGINSNIYGAAIPEGNYQFCFEVYGAVTNNKLSSKTCASTYIFNNEPPLLNIPLNKANIEPSEVENIVFQWTPRHINVSNVEYELSMVEIWDDMVDPQTAFLTSPPFFQTTTRTTTFIYGPGQPLLLAGKRYAWQVRAKALQGIEEVGLFRNEGKSEIFWFSRTESCKAPNSVYAEAKGKTKVNVFWEEDTSLFSEYTIEYKEANDVNAKWFSMTTNSSWATIWHLKPATTYEFKVQGKCKFQSGDFSAIQQVTTADDEDESANYNCGIVPDIEAVSNRTPHPGLQIGDSVTAGDFIVTITEINSQSNGVLSGTGFVKIPYLKYARFAVKFEDILVNTENQLAQGEIVTLYDPFFGEDATMTVNVEVDIKDKITGDGGEKHTAEVDFVIAEVITRDNGATIIKGENGEEQVIPGGRDTEITDSEGRVYSISEDGEVTKGEKAEGGPATVSNNNGVNEEGVSEVSDIGVRIDFMDSGFYSYDVVSASANDIIKGNYPPINIGDAEYQVPYKAIATIEGTDFIKAKADITNDKYSVADVIFKTKDGVKIEASWEASVATLSLKQKFDYQIEDIIATVVSKEDTEKQEVIGAFKLVHLSTLEAGLTIIPLNNARLESGLAESINKIYHKAGVHFNTTVNSSVDLSGVVWDLDGDGKLEVADSSVISFYTPEQKVIINHIKNQPTYNKDTYYMFVGDMVVSKPDVDGFMPLGEQFGFVFGASNQERTLAHELGHGAFGLKHPFTEYKTPQGATNYLMDYGSGTVINHMDWKKIHARGFQFNWLQGDDDGASNIVDNITLKNGVLEILEHIKKRYNGEEDEFNWSKFVRSSGGQSKGKSSTQFIGNYTFNLGGEELVFSLKEQPSIPETIKIIPGEEKLIIEDNNVFKTNVIYQLTLDAGNGSFLFEFDTHDQVEAFANYLKIDRDQSFTEPNQSDFSKDIIKYLEDNHLPKIINPAACGSIGLFFKEIPKKYLYNKSEEDLWSYIKALLYPNCTVDDIGVSEEEVLIKLIETLGVVKDKTDLLRELTTRKSYSGDILFASIYKKIDNWGGEDNFTAFINSLYIIWVKSEYSNAPIVDEIPYQVDKSFGFFGSNFKIALSDDYLSVEVYGREVSSTSGRSNIYSDVRVSNHIIYDPISLVKYEEMNEIGMGIQAPTTKVPMFILAAIAQNQKTHNIDKAGNLAIDAGLTFSGIGNVTKLRYLKQLGKLNLKTSYELADGLTTSLGAINFMLEYSGECDKSDNPEAYCTRLKEYLSLVESSLSVGAGNAYLIKRKGDELLQELKKKKNQTPNDENLDNVIKELEKTLDAVNSENLNFIKELSKLNEQGVLNFLTIKVNDVALTLSTTSYLLKYTTNTKNCKDEALCENIQQYLGYVGKAVSLKTSLGDPFKSYVSKLITQLKEKPNTIEKTDEIINDLTRIQEVDLSWQVKLNTDINKSIYLKSLFDSAASTRKADLEQAYKVLESFPNIRIQKGNIEVLADIHKRFVYQGKEGFEALTELIANGSSASKQKLIDGLEKAHTIFPENLPVKFSGIKKGEVTVSDTRVIDNNGKGDEIVRFVDGRLENKKFIPSEDAHEYEIVKDFSDGEDGILLKKDNQLGFKYNVRNSSFKNTTYKEFVDTVDDFANGAKGDLADRAFELWGNNKWIELEKLFVANNINKDSRGVIWPPFNGVKSIVKTERGSELVGKVFDRFQTRSGLGGRFASEVESVNNGVNNLVYTFDNRALSTNIEKGTYYIKFKIKESIPSDLEFKYGETIPWFGLQGNGQQVESTKPLNDIDSSAFEIMELLQYDGSKWIEIKQ